MVTQRELLDAYNRLSSRIVRGTGDRLSTVFSSLGSWRDADFERFLPLVQKTTAGASLQAAKLQVAFYQQMAQALGEEFTAPKIRATDLSVSALRNGAEAAEVYRRPFVDLYTALDKGKTMTQAVDAGARRISSIASTDIQLARRNAGFATRGRNDGIVGYARTLTGAENCALCYVASTQRYTRGELMPIHPGCDCGEMPIYGNQDPGQVIDEVRLEATHEAVQQRFGSSDRGGREIDYRKIAIREHGELGPMLTIADQNFTGPNQL
tara:strand:+ start:547 stop:1347 length:801 start_codon:yes stop_codon:yes gene_type:complete